LKSFAEKLQTWGPDRRRSGPYLEAIFSSEIKAMRANSVGVMFGSLSTLAITLQRSPPSRLLGTELFEDLLEAGAYGIDEVLGELDRRIAA